MNFLLNLFRKKEKFIPPARWIDLHAHILPDVDDGPRRLDEAIEMVKKAAEIGITHIVATPHYSDLFPTTIEKKKKALEKLQNAIHDNNINIEILSGWEVSFTDIHIKQIISQENFFIAEKSKYVLIELPNGINKKSVIEGIYSMMLAGIKLILAHPERSLLIQQHPEVICDLRLRGVKTQIDAGSLLGKHGHNAKIVAIELLEKSEADILSSDAHSLQGYDDYYKACKFVNEQYGKVVIDKLLKEQPEIITEIK